METTKFATSLFDFDFSSEPASKPYDIPQVRLSYASTPQIRSSKTVKSSDDLIQAFRDSYEDGEIEYREHFKCAYMNHANKIIGIQEIGIGSAEMVVTDLKAIFTGALLCRASTIAVCHNHPSGTLRPSAQDDNLTRKIKEAAKFLDFRFLDHIILTEDSYYSYADNGKL